MWWNKRVPYKIKRTLFRGAVSSLHFSIMTETTFVCRGAWKKSSARSCSERPHGKDKTIEGLSALAKGGKGGGWRLLHTSSVCKGSDDTRALPESRHVMHISFVVGLVECTSNRTTHSLRVFACILRQMVLRSDYWQTYRRWLLFLSGLSRLQTLNWSLVTSSVWGAKLTIGFSRWI